MILNVLNNAFYAVQQKKGYPNYLPLVKLTTGIKKGKIEIKIKDNGIGIPLEIRDKILQPFFTTKPPGEGTGLGLSLTFEVIVKQNEGSIEVNSQPGEYTEFIITLPFNKG